MVDPLYAVAREVLLDALEALAAHRDSIILVGAQAIYVHTGDAEMAVPVFTSDGDLLIEPARLKAAPKIGDAMAKAHFRRGQQPGSWLCDRMVEGVPATIPVDLLVPEAVAGSGRRGARLGGHGNQAGRRARGLEGALVDREPWLLKSLAVDDGRVFHIQAAGPTALLVAKLHKIVDRSQEPGTKRLKDKDALDVLRILRTIPSRRLSEGLIRLGTVAVSSQVTSEAIEHLRALFGSSQGQGTRMAVRATERLEDPATIAASCEALTRELLDLLADQTK
jgi:hypothetical protein